MATSADSAPSLTIQRRDGACPSLLISSSDTALLERTKMVLELLQDRLAYGDSGQLSRMVESLVPYVQSPTPAALDQVRRNAEARGRLLREFGALTSAQVHEQAGMGSANKAATANRWRREKKLITLSHEGRLRFPAFQFDADGRPRPAVAAVIRLFGDEGWQTGLWFLASNPWLGGDRPVDRLDDDPEAVIQAARSEVENAF